MHTPCARRRVATKENKGSTISKRCVSGTREPLAETKQKDHPAMPSHTRRTCKTKPRLYIPPVGTPRMYLRREKVTSRAGFSSFISRRFAGKVELYWHVQRPIADICTTTSSYFCSRCHESWTRSQAICETHNKTCIECRYFELVEFALSKVF